MDNCAICGKELSRSNRVDEIRHFIKAFDLFLKQPQYKDKTLCITCLDTEMVESPFRDAEKLGIREVAVQDQAADWKPPP